MGYSYHLLPLVLAGMRRGGRPEKGTKHGRRWGRAAVPESAAGGGHGSAVGRLLKAEEFMRLDATPQLSAVGAEACKLLADNKTEHIEGRLSGNGKVAFPVMRPDELAPLTVHASVPAGQLRDVLERHGLCLVTDVLGTEECSLMEQLWHEDLLQVVDSESLRAGGRSPVGDRLQLVQQSGLAAWPSDWSSCWGRKGVASEHGLPHGRFAWSARLHPEVRRVFASIFEVPVDDLAVGVDCVFWAAADTPAAAANDEWLHCDQNHLTGLTWPCVQGVLYIWPSDNERASTTVIWPGSHAGEYAKLLADPSALKKSGQGGQSLRLGSLHDLELKADLVARGVAGARRVPCPRGSLLLWDSRTIHQGWAGGPRLAQPVCWEPRSRRGLEARRRKLWMCAAGLPSSHSSTEARIHGMAPRRRPDPCSGTPTQPPLRATLLPYGIASGCEDAWHSMQNKLWRSRDKPRANAEWADEVAITDILRGDVAAAL